MSTLWSKGTQATDLVENFTVGNDRILDMRLAKYDVQGSMAHIKMLESIVESNRNPSGKRPDFPGVADGDTRPLYVTDEIKSSNNG